MNAELREAVERFDGYMDAVLGEYPSGESAWQTIRQALRDQEAEIGMLQDVADTNAELYQHELLRTQRAESLLRECRLFVAWASERLPEATPTYDRITAHLGVENNG